MHGPDLGIQPALAARWETPEETVWHFELREGTSFHDGTPLTAASVVEGLERVRADPTSPARSWLSSVAALEAPSPSRVVVLTRWPDPLLLHHLAQIPIALGRTGEEVNARACGTGPFRMARRDAGGGLLLEAFAGWKGARPAVRRARFVVVPEGAPTLTALREARIDLAALPLTIEAAGALPFPTEEAHGLTTMFLWIGSLGTPSRNPLADVRVRRAIDLALDRRAIGLRATGRADAAAGALVLPAIFGYQPDLARTAHDPAAARGLLAEAGHRGGLTLPLVFRDATLARRSAEVVAEQLAAVGIRTRPRAVSYEESLRPYREGANGLFLDPWTFDVPDASSFLADCLRTREPASGRGLLNPGFASARLDAAIDLGSSLLDASARLEAIRKALRLADEEVPAVPLFEVTRLWGRARDVAFTPRVDGRIVLSEISFRAPP